MQKVYPRQHTWLGHVLQKSNERISKIALEGKVEGKRLIDKLKISWLLTALKRCGLNLGEAIETSKNRSDRISICPTDKAEMMMNYFERHMPLNCFTSLFGVISGLSTCEHTFIILRQVYAN